MDNILITEKSKDYELLDSGREEKLERYGSSILSRPEPQALWDKSLPEEEWKKADAVFKRTGKIGKWKILTKIPDSWKVTLEGLTFSLKLLPSKHLGLFPEQSSHWRWLEEKIKKQIDSGKSVSVLNLFGYSGGATLVCARAGASVCHVDASKFAVDLAHENLDLNGLGDQSVRFIVDDARKFIEREIKRGVKYDIILLDPPVYGKGVKGEIWKIEEDLSPLLSRLKSVLSDEPQAIILNGYASNYSSTTYAEMLYPVVENLNGSLYSGELAIKDSKGRLLSCGIFAKWEN